MDDLLEVMEAQLAGGREEVDMGEERENGGDLPEAIEDVEDQEREERRGGRHERGAAHSCEAGRGAARGREAGRGAARGRGRGAARGHGRGRGRGAALDCGAGEGSWVCPRYVDVEETCLTRTVMCIHSIMFYTHSLFYADATSAIMRFGTLAGSVPHADKAMRLEQ